ncbi:MAG: hypothetical protein KZQ94_20855 [Candidatus Thiodiazotropha sp. (ex Troendleina suluensis)]|nr:hypothetical protein [Candidatus Thiodiazotropha sp. (ex Troendleina suluensis)]
MINSNFDNLLFCAPSENEGRKFTLAIPLEHAELISEEAHNMKGCAAENAYYLAALLAMTLNDTGRPADYILAGCSHAIAMLTDLASALEIFEIEAQSVLREEQS